MNITVRIFSLYCLLFLLFTSNYGCKKEGLPISDNPSIKFVSISPNPAIKYVDEISIQIEYTDGDGDLGENTPDVKNLFVTDKRNGVISKFRINQLAPSGSEISITGLLNVKLSPQGFVDDNNTSESTTYDIYVVDRAGHQSNIVSTSTLQINQ